MSEVAIGLAGGLLTGIVVAVLLQGWPSRYRWAAAISLTEGERSGSPIHQVQLRRPRRRWWRRRRNLIDLTFHARVAVKGIGQRPESEKIVPIPVEREWRPVVAGGVLTVLFPQFCDPRDLRYFPPEIKAKRDAGTLRLEDLLAVGDATLRMYCFAYRPYLGTRLMVRGSFRIEQIVPGVYERGVIQPTADGRPPPRPEMLAPVRFTRPARRPPVQFTVGAWTLSIARQRRASGT